MIHILQLLKFSYKKYTVIKKKQQGVCRAQIHPSSDIHKITYICVHIIIHVYIYIYIYTFMIP